jgi:hypothetical protein
MSSIMQECSANAAVPQVNSGRNMDGGEVSVLKNAALVIAVLSLTLTLSRWERERPCLPLFYGARQAPIQPLVFF